MTTVIIPAHNEAAVIEDTLDALLASIAGSPAEVLVVCNGCTDDTAARARQYCPRVRVLETPVGSKPHALNLGDEHATSFPRLYLDGDVLVSPTLIQDLTAALDTDQPCVAYPDVRYETRGCAPLVRAFYATWTSLPYNRPGRIGVGLYALNEAGRARFDRFPNIISDDGFIRGLFTHNEVRIAESCWTTVRAPATFGDLVRTKTRSRLGRYQLHQQFPDILQKHATSHTRLQIAHSLLRSPMQLAYVPIYLFVNALTRIRARSQLKSLANYQWERDESSRAQTTNSRQITSHLKEPNPTVRQELASQKQTKVRDEA